MSERKNIPRSGDSQLQISNITSAFENRKSLLAESDHEYSDDNEVSQHSFEAQKEDPNVQSLVDDLKLDDSVLKSLDSANGENRTEDGDKLLTSSNAVRDAIEFATLASADEVRRAAAASDTEKDSVGGYKHLHKLMADAKRLYRIRFRNGVPRSNFSDVKHIATESILESDVARNSEFWGFYSPFWLGVAVLMISVASHSIRNKGFHDAFFNSRIVQIFFQDIVWVALCDLTLYLQLYLTFFLQCLIKKDVVGWETHGWYIQSLYEFGYLVMVLWWLELKTYSWIGKVFLVLHSIVFLMKMHSYAFYNGYLWRIVRELNFSKGYLKKHDGGPSLKDGSLDASTKETLLSIVEFCEFELAQTSVTGDGKYQFPSNINFHNFFMYTMFPTVVYEIKYPRNSKVRWSYVATKLCGIFGIIGVMITVAQEGVYPLAIKGIAMRDWPIMDRVKEYPFLMLDMIPLFFLLYILVFFLIWDQILNAIAELTRFADRDFYGPWWNCVTWDEFARLWNTPVHKFLLRHVYHSSISALHLSKTSATLVTFMLSSLFHELVMYVIFGKLRFYLFAIQMYQLPLIAISRSKFMRNRKLLGNVIFWIGIATGAALISSLYLVF